MGLVSGPSLRATFEELAGRGRAGTVKMRHFLDGHPDDWVPPASGVEGRFGAIMDKARLGTWRRQVDVGATTWVGRVDFLHGSLPLVVEVQSERYHTALLDQAADAVRKASLEAAGFLVVEVSDTEVWHDRNLVIAKVRDGVRAARAKAACGSATGPRPEVAVGGRPPGPDPTAGWSPPSNSRSEAARWGVI